MRAAAALFCVLTAPAGLAGDPVALIGQARQDIEKKQYDAAVKVLQEALPDAAKFAEPDRTQALAALHFYTAVAYSGMGDDARSRGELERFFELMPRASKIDPLVFDANFVTRFREVRTAVSNPQSTPFDSVYPGFRPLAGEMPPERSLEEWPTGPEMTLLATDEEKETWKKLADDNARRHFIDGFWLNRPDELRRLFLRRVTFADDKFATTLNRGSMTDRGRVFVLFGPPQSVRSTPLRKVERWVYPSEPAGEVVLRFLDDVLLLDPGVEKAMRQSATQ